WPSADPKKSDFLHPSMFFSVAENSEHPDEAVAVVDYIINSIDCNNILLGERGIPATSVVANALAENLSDLGKKEVAFINDVVTPNSSTISPVEPEGATEVFALADQLVEKVLYGVMTAEEASAELYNQGNTIMQRNAKKK
ncbi:MAG: carbohydrate ABC transporter substrate-binding protein, partial [Bacteroidales bacterium]|nr:carbohydrate ABC transporter substrate-binding protein [Bacteroidales bacterium]